MRIGFTERGDAGRDFSWFDKLSTVDGAILITKSMSDHFNDLVLTAEKPVIVHVGCTGWGETWLEPNAPDFKTQLGYAEKLVERGFDPARLILRIDPMIPTPEGMERVRAVLDYVIKQDLPFIRFRMSVMDEYPHVRQRLIDIGKQPFYNGAFTAPKPMKELVVRTLEEYPFQFETCAEDWLAMSNTTDDKPKFVVRGCCSTADLRLMNLPLPDNRAENMQGRNGCHCLSCKTELLERRAQCPNGCKYCYWKPTTH